MYGSEWVGEGPPRSWSSRTRRTPAPRSRSPCTAYHVFIQVQIRVKEPLSYVIVRREGHRHDMVIRDFLSRSEHVRGDEVLDATDKLLASRALEPAQHSTMKTKTANPFF